MSSETTQRIDVPCVLCGSGLARVCYRMRDYRVQRCEECGLVAINPRIPEKKTAELYESLYEGRADVPDESRPERYRVTIDEHHKRRPAHATTRETRRRLKILETLTPGRQLLDVGCGAGFFLLDAAERGWKVMGLEVSESAVAYAGGLGLDVQQGALVDGSLEPESVDAVTMWYVLEHLHEPLRDLKRVWEALRPGGIVGIATPNYDSVLRMLKGRQWPAFKPGEHLSIFGPHTMDLLFEAAAFEPVKMTTTRTELIQARRFFHERNPRIPGPVYDLLGLSQSVVNISVGKLVFYHWEKLLRGDILEIYARRR